MTTKEMHTRKERVSFTLSVSLLLNHFIHIYHIKTATFLGGKSRVEDPAVLPLNGLVSFSANTTKDTNLSCIQ